MCWLLYPVFRSRDAQGFLKVFNSHRARHCSISEAEDWAGSLLETLVEATVVVEDCALAATAKRPATMKEVKRILGTKIRLL